MTYYIITPKDPPGRTGRPAEYPYQEALEILLADLGVSYTLRIGRRTTMDAFVERFKRFSDPGPEYELTVSTRDTGRTSHLAYRDREVEVFAEINPIHQRPKINSTSRSRRRLRRRNQRENLA